MNPRSPKQTGKDQQQKMSSEEAIALMRLIAGESIDSNMLDKVPGAFAKILPLVLEKLVEENRNLQSGVVKAEEALRRCEGRLGQQDKRISELVEKPRLEKEDLAGFSPKVRDLIKEIFQLRSRLAELETRFEHLSKGVGKLNRSLDGNEISEKELENLSGEIRSLGRRLVNYKLDMDEKLARELRENIREALESGNFDRLPGSLRSDLAELVVDKLENLVKPYNELSNRFMAGEISREEFSENLQQNTLLQHLRDKIIADIVVALSTGRLDSPDIPDSLRAVIRRMIVNSNVASAEERREAKTLKMGEDVQISPQRQE